MRFLLCDSYVGLSTSNIIDGPPMQICPHPKLQANSALFKSFRHLCNHGGGSGGLVSPCWWKNTNGLVVTGETVDSGLDENETELGVFILSVALEMLADGNGLGIFISI
jgi:hypothetical protein